MADGGPPIAQPHTLDASQAGAKSARGLAPRVRYHGLRGRMRIRA